MALVFFLGFSLSILVGGLVGKRIRSIAKVIIAAILTAAAIAFVELWLVTLNGYTPKEAVWHFFFTGLFLYPVTTIISALVARRRGGKQKSDTSQSPSPEPSNQWHDDEVLNPLFVVGETSSEPSNQPLLAKSTSSVKKQTMSKSNKEILDVDGDEGFWEEAAEEFDNNRNKGLWTKCLTACDENEKEARVAYLTKRVQQFTEAERIRGEEEAKAKAKAEEAERIRAEQEIKAKAKAEETKRIRLEQEAKAKAKAEAKERRKTFWAKAIRVYLPFGSIFLVLFLFWYDNKKAELEEEAKKTAAVEAQRAEQEAEAKTEAEEAERIRLEQEAKAEEVERFRAEQEAKAEEVERIRAEQEAKAKAKERSKKFWEMVAESKPFSIPELSLDMLWVKPGTFEMGSPTTEAGRGGEEILHPVILTEGFHLGKNEVTQSQWERVMGSNPSRHKGADRPVERVSWTGVTAFCEKLTALEREAGRLPAGMAYQLPTEAQWEYACRAGTTTAYAFGDSLTSGQANISGGPRGTTEVGKYPANGWGFHDMHGNVWEWCADWYGDYPAGAVRDPVGPADGSFRVLRGGSWFYSAYSTRSAHRFRDGPAGSHWYLGFRLSLRPPASQ